MRFYIILLFLKSSFSNRSEKVFTQLINPSYADYNLENKIFYKNECYHCFFEAKSIKLCVTLDLLNTVDDGYSIPVTLPEGTLLRRQVFHTFIGRKLHNDKMFKTCNQSTFLPNVFIRESSRISYNQKHADALINYHNEHAIFKNYLFLQFLDFRSAEVRENIIFICRDEECGSEIFIRNLTFYIASGIISLLLICVSLIILIYCRRRKKERDDVSIEYAAGENVSS